MQHCKQQHTTCEPVLRSIVAVLVSNITLLTFDSAELAMWSHA